MVRNGRLAAPNALGMEQLVAFKAEPMLDGKPVTAEGTCCVSQKLQYLMRCSAANGSKSTRKEIRQVLRYMKKEERTIYAVIRMASSGCGGRGGCSLERVIRFWCGIRRSARLPAGRTGASQCRTALSAAELRGELRPYRERGYQWLSAMRELGFGVCLADDMGLGKTIQVITCLLDQKHEEQQAAAEEARENEMYGSG